MNFGQSIRSGFKRYLDFSGRSSRSEYWWWALLNVILSVFSSVLVVNAAAEYEDLAVTFYLIVNLVMFVPNLAMSVRRFHDLDRSGWWLFIGVIPLVGPIILIFWFCTKGTDGANRFGIDPLE